MKLYTEADLKKVISIYSEEYKTSTDEILKELNLIPIEIPSDEEIKKSTPYPLSKGFYNPLYSNKWEEGAKWMRDKLQRDKQ
jgi:hypothetical protein